MNRGELEVIIEGDSYASLLRQGLHSLLTSGRPVSPRDLPTLELQHVVMQLRHPQRRFPRLEGRNASIYALVAETIWVIAGRNDLAFIESYLPRMASFSDDEVTLHGGYGPRLRHWRGTDQLLSVIDTLKSDRYSRRAVISLFDPSIDHDQTKKDIPCCTLIQFTFSANRIDCSVYSRSMDIMWGSAINFFEWTTLQEAVAMWLDCSVGTYTHHIGSLHIYSEFVQRAKRIVDAEAPSSYLTATPFDIPLSNLHGALLEYFRIESAFRAGDLHESAANVDSGWLFEAIELTRSYWIFKHTKDFQRAEATLNALPSTEASAMAIDHLSFLRRRT